MIIAAHGRLRRRSSWLGTGQHGDNGSHELSPKTVERYRELAVKQIVPHLGNTLLQKLTPDQIEKWHAALRKGGAKDGGPLSARTVGHAHRVLHWTLQRAVENLVLMRNVASIKSPPKVKKQEVEVLTEDQIALVTDKLVGHPLYEIAVVDLATGMRRGEL